MDRKKIIRAIQFVAKPTARLATNAVNKVTDLAIPRTKEFMADWQREWDKDASNFKPTIIQPLAKPASSSQDPSDVGICNICTGPYIDGNCQEYKCWK
jgi:hypothetical protein